ncbi:hypothetical protein EW145_g5839 [Phellinidium pouzarii]|uniref:chitinase n=1 Tax=Phellinidium pouzarii TaxID=167371 RepID=A0A4S4KYQ0_9AGAM|nr:hypothetical protein EW145_g5839 [Phellinidium pouzarii]
MSDRMTGRCGLWQTAWIALVLALTLGVGRVVGFDINRNDNLAVYWGQDSSGHQQRLSYYCQDDVYNTIPLAFLYVFFGVGSEPEMSFANTCNEGNGTFPGTELSNCTFMAADIEQCQSKGKIITISLGGADSSVGFVNESQAEGFADTIWSMFLGGNGDIRPFGNAVLDGVDLDIEGGLPTFYSDFVDRLRTHTDNADKTYYITAAPQCPFPDANVGPAINASRFDAIYVQFYNNYCGLNYPTEFDFSLWDEWARTQSPNPDVKIYIGAPGSATAAGQGYVNTTVLQEYALAAQRDYTTFGGVMLWDASDAYENNRYDKAIKTALSTNGQEISNGGGSGSGTNSTSPSGGSGTDGSGDGGGLGDGGGGGGDAGSECFQSRLASLAGGELIASRDGIKIIYSETPMSKVALSNIPTLRQLYAASKLVTSQAPRYAPVEMHLGRISVYQGDITMLEVDAIVNAANRSLLVDGAIHRAAGRALLQECQTLDGCDTGDAKITKGYNLPAKHVIHTVGPVYSVRSVDVTAGQLASCYKRSLTIAAENTLKSIAFPSISTGVYGYPVNDATRIALDETRRFLDSENGASFNRVVFTVFSDEDLSTYE